jgi:hypothetical protein
MTIAMGAYRQVRLASVEVTAYWGLKIPAAVSELAIRASALERKVPAFVLELKPAAVAAEAEPVAAPLAQALEAAGLESAAFWATDSAETLAPQVRMTKQKN